MLTQVLETPIALEDDNRGSGRPFTVPTLPIFVHIITLRHPITGDEQILEVETTSDRFCEVYRAICWQRAERRLLGYQIFETWDCNDPF